MGGMIDRRSTDKSGRHSARNECIASAAGDRKTSVRVAWFPPIELRISLHPPLLMSLNVWLMTLSLDQFLSV